MERIGNPEPTRRGQAASERAPHERRRTNSDRTSTCVPNMNSKPHCGAAALRAAASSLSFLTAFALACQQRPSAVDAPDARFRLSLSLKGIGAACASRNPLRIGAGGGFASRIRLAPLSSHRHRFMGDKFAADVPDAQTRCNRNLDRQPSLHKAPDRELASRLWDLAESASFALPECVFCGHLGSA